MPGTGWALKSYGFMFMVGFLSATYLAMRRCLRVKCDPDAILNITMVALFAGVIGARVFFVIHYWDENFANSRNVLLDVINLTQGGLEFLGGVVPAIFAVGAYIVWKKWSVRLYADFMAIVVAWGLAFGRVGCFLNGCCFGGACVDDQGLATSALAVEFPFGSPASIRQWQERRLTFPAELIFDGFKEDGRLDFWEAMPIGRDLLAMSPEARTKPLRRYEEKLESYERAKSRDPDGETTRELAAEVDRLKRARNAHQLRIAPLTIACKYPSRASSSRPMTFSELHDLADQYHAQAVHPTQLYSAVAAFLLANVLARLFHRRKRHGMVWGVFLLAYPPTRVLLEMIRADNPLDTFGLTASQAISIGLMIGGVIWLVAIYRFMPERSPAAVPYEPPCEPAADGA